MKNVQVKFISSVLLICMLFSISSIPVSADIGESGYITASYDFKTPLGNYHVEVSRFHNGYCGPDGKNNGTLMFMLV